MKKKKKRHGSLVLLVALGVAVGLVAFSSQPVMAATLSIGDDTVTTDNGSVTDITVDLSTEVTWDGAENEPGQTDIKLQIREPDGNWETLASESTELSGLAGTYQTTFSNVDITQSDWNKEDFRATGDGSTQETELTFRLVIEASGNLDGDDNRETTTVQSSTEVATITATNEANSNSAGGNGNVDVSGTNNEP